MDNSEQSLLSYELELYRQLYMDEINRRNQYSDKVFKSIPVFVPLIGAIMWLIFNFTKIYTGTVDVIDFIIFVLIIICSIIMLAATINFFRTLYCYEEHRIDPEAVSQMILDYKKQTKNNENIIKTVNESMIETYRSCAIHNSKQSKKRMEKFNEFYWLILLEIIFLIIAFVAEFCA